MTDTRYCPRWGCWVADCDPCECAARDRAEDRAEHIEREERRPG